MVRNTQSQVSQARFSMPSTNRIYLQT